jgi:cyclin B
LLSIQDELLIESIGKINSSSSAASNRSSLSSNGSLSDNLVNFWEDIDAEDKDEFSSSDYVSTIFKYYRERESKFVVDDYLRRQPHLNKQMRLLLVDWMVEVQQQLEFNHEVLYLSVKLLDIYLNSRLIEKEKLQLLGGAAMFVACKFEERMPPIIDDFIYVSDNAYDRNDLIRMEIEILKTVRFDIGAPLSYTFLRRYSKCVKADMRFLTLARYILELSLQDYNFAYVSDSIKACAALYLALKMSVNYDRQFKLLQLKHQQQNGNAEMLLQPEIVSIANLTSTEWNSTLVHYTGAFLKDFIEHVPAMNNLLKTAVTCKYKTIYKKYSHQ